MTNNNILLKIENLYKAFGDKNHEVTILKNINLEIVKGESVAIIGESGCGKTTLGKIIANITSPTRGKIFFKGQDISILNQEEYKKFRVKVQIVQQDSFAALNPNKTIFHSLSSAILFHKIVKDETEARAKVKSLLEEVGLEPAEHYIDKYPHQLSGGQRQRILIARAISVNPELIVADEPVSMVDVSLRISLLQLMRKMTEKYNVSFVYITHDLATARYISNKGKMVVMYLGEIIEMGDILTSVKNPIHPYFKALLKAVPELNPNKIIDFKNLPLKSMDIPDVTNVPSGCPFNPRCIYAIAKCPIEKPELAPVENKFVSCHLSSTLCNK